MIACIDTSAYSAMRRGNRSIASILETADTIVVPTVVLGELYAGFTRGTRERENNLDLEEFLSLPGVEICPVTEQVARRYALVVKALLHDGTPIPTNDVWIASIALDTGARLVTLDAHSKQVPTLIVDGPE